MILTGFTPDELQLGFMAWRQLSVARRPHLDPKIRRWLGEWSLWDLACSPMCDKERALIRYGHYLGFVHAINLVNTPPGR